MRCVTGVSTAAAVGNCFVARAAKASRPFGGSSTAPSSRGRDVMWPLRKTDSRATRFPHHGGLERALKGFILRAVRENVSHLEDPWIYQFYWPRAISPAISTTRIPAAPKVRGAPPSPRLSAGPAKAVAPAPAPAPDPPDLHSSLPPESGAQIGPV